VTAAWVLVAAAFLSCSTLTAERGRYASRAACEAAAAALRAAEPDLVDHWCKEIRQ